MDLKNEESALLKYMPSGRRVMFHFMVMFILAGLLGPLVGPWLLNWINPPQAWGIANRIGDYSPINVLLWGFAFLMFEVLFYTGWLIAQAKKSWVKAQPKSWYN